MARRQGKDSHVSQRPNRVERDVGAAQDGSHSLGEVESSSPDQITPLLRDRSFLGMMATQFLGAFNDNLYKQLIFASPAWGCGGWSWPLVC
jgi:hypothetical protein